MTSTAPAEATEGAEPQRMEPPVSMVSEAFWEATRDKQLVLQHCGACDRAIWFPRHVCPHCSATELGWRPASGTGSVYAFSVQYRPGLPQLKDRVPYTVALVDLAEGVRMMTNIVGCAPDDVTVGQEVVAAWEPMSDGRHLLVFEPATQT